MKVFVSGASGFVGQALCAQLNTLGHEAFPVGRRVSGAVAPAHSSDFWVTPLSCAEVVVHLAARVHVMDDRAGDPLDEFRAANVGATVELAYKAANAGVRRFVFLSSVKVLGEEGTFSELSQPAPVDAYGQSKWEAELALREVAKQTGLEVVVIRPPLVYGPGVRANFLRLIRTVRRGTPLPFGLVENHRSLVYLGNLVSAIIACLAHPSAAGKTYLVSDGEDISTPELIRRLAAALQAPARLIPLSPALMKLGGTLIGRGREMERLLGSLVVDSHVIRRDLDWSSPYSMAQGLQATADWYCGSTDK
ncbi:MAG TPA: NAD-dependent epimerase/dehydratase family protein [Rhodocyclaceae bacterium]|nr:NAD-dependent epimerase/dehydratase family protein [Rhodocyclaceae bacterium]